MIPHLDFGHALLDAQRPLPANLQDGQGRPAGRRFDVYRNNVVMGLKDALAASFPLLEKLLGPQNFSQLSGLFLRAHPPRDPRIQTYGADLPAFLEDFAPLSHLPYLADVARLECALRDSYHSADAPCVAQDVFAQTPPDVLASSTLILSPALRLVGSDWPIYDIWRFNTQADAPQPRGEAQDCLIVRPEYDPLPLLLPQGGADLIEALASKATLGDALSEFEARHPDADATAILGMLLANDAICAVTNPTPPSSDQ